MSVSLMHEDSHGRIYWMPKRAGHPDYGRVVTVKTLCQMDTEPKPKAPESTPFDVTPEDLNQPIEIQMGVPKQEEKQKDNG